MCVLSCLPASEHFRSDVGKTKEGSIPPLVYSIVDRSDKQVSTNTFRQSDIAAASALETTNWEERTED